VDIPTLTVQTDDELSATQRTTALTNRTGGRRRLTFLQKIRRAAAKRLRQGVARRRERAANRANF